MNIFKNLTLILILLFFLASNFLLAEGAVSPEKALSQVVEAIIEGSCLRPEWVKQIEAQEDLMQAVHSGNLELVNLAIDNGADVNHEYTIDDSSGRFKTEFTAVVKYVRTNRDATYCHPASGNVQGI